MEDIVATIAEQKIREAMRNGEFEDLPGKGKPLQLEDLSHIPEELRAGYIILKNGGILPVEMQVEKEITSLKTLMNSCYDESERQEFIKELNAKMIRLNIMLEKRHLRGRALIQYRGKILDRLR